MIQISVHRIMNVFINIVDNRDFPFIPMGMTVGVDQVYLSTTSGISTAVDIPHGFPFGSTTQTSVHVSIIALLSGLTCIFVYFTGGCQWILCIWKRSTRFNTGSISASFLIT